LKKFLLYLLAFVLLAYLTSIATGTRYIWKALIYNYVDYDDYKIFDNRTIDNDRKVEWPMASALRQIEISADLDAYLTKMETIGFLAIRNDSVVYEKYWDGYDSETIANSFSVAKSYISMLTGFAIQDGAIESVDDKVRKYLPELNEETFGSITIRHLLTMSSGLEWTESYGGPINHTTEGYYGTNLWNLVSSLNLEHEPGQVFRYKGCDPQLLAFVIEKASGKSLSNYLSQKFWKPVGSTAKGLWSLDDKEGMEKAYCCINASARNFARIGKLYLNYGNWNGRQLLDSGWIAQSVAPHLLPDKSGQSTQYYGWQWWCMNDINKNVFYCRGLNGQYVICFPDKNLVLVRIGHKRETSGNHPTDLLKMVEWAETL